MTWDVEYTDQFGEWFESCDEAEQNAVDAAVGRLRAHGPALRRPYVGHIESSRHPHMKELIPPGGHLRILFAFDPLRHAILLIGGDKTDRWQEFYDQYVPTADDLYDEHLRTLRNEGLL